MSAGYNAMVDAAGTVALRIKERTKSGMSADGKAFERYKPDPKNPALPGRHARARMKKGLRITPPDLWFDGREGGHMLDAIRVTGASGQQIETRAAEGGSGIRGAGGRFERFREVRIAIDDPVQARKAASNQYGTRYAPARPFMGLTPGDIDTVTNFVGRSVDQSLSQAKGGTSIEIRVFG